METHHTALDWIASQLPGVDTLRRTFDALWPICRSITGSGLRRSLSILTEIVPLQLTEVPTGTRVFDWTVPDEWNIENAFIDDETGKRLVDFGHNNLHVVNYSIPFNGEMTLAELQPHLHSLPERPEAIPYVTSYYERRWGFCLSHKQRQSLKPGRYRVRIDSTLRPGALTYGDTVLPATDQGGSESGQVLLSTYLCHPSMANNELSGPLVATHVIKALSQLPHRRFSYRLVVAPETIGALCYLKAHGDELKKTVRAGFVITCCGLDQPFTFKRTLAGDALIDRLSTLELSSSGNAYSAVEFFPSGSDERQYSSPGFRLPIASLMRGPYTTYPEYHTSDDNKSLISFPALKTSIEMYLRIILSLEKNTSFRNTIWNGEPMLCKYQLYPTLGGKLASEFIRKMQWLLNLSDGQHDLLSIAQRAQCSILDLSEIAQTLRSKGLLSDC